MVEKEEIDEIQRETGYDRDLLEKVYHLSYVISEMVKDELISKNLALKGGTSLNLLHLDIPRLSTDLDFNFIGTLDRDEMLKAREEIEKIIEKLGSDMGYDVEKRGSSYIILRYIFRYQKTTGTKDHVKIEINFLQRMPIVEIEKYEFRSIVSKIDPFLVPTFTLEELCAQKIVACLDRYLFRDIYDVYVYSMLELDVELTKKLVTVYFCMNSSIKEPDLSFFQDIDPKELEQNLRQFVRNNFKHDPNTIVDKAKTFMEELLNFSGESIQFINGFYDEEEEVRSSLLFPNRDHLSQHPSLIFQLSRLRKKKEEME